MAFEELEATASDDGPVMPQDVFEYASRRAAGNDMCGRRYVRQTMEVDFEQFIEPLESLSRKARERQERSDEAGSVVGELDQAALFQALDEHLSQYPGLAEVEAFNQAMGIAHDEDVSAWVGTISKWMVEQQAAMIPLVQLQQAVGLPLIQLWLASLLGGFAIEQRGEFYETQPIWG